MNFASAVDGSSVEQLKEAFAALPESERQKIQMCLDFVDDRQVTGLERPGATHGCKPAEIVPGVWNAHFEDIDTADKLKAISPSINLVINCACEKCDTTAGSYGEGVDVLRLDGFLDSPPGDAKKEFDRVIGAIDGAKAKGGGALLHCFSSVSRSVVFVLAYMMKTQKLSLVEAIKQMKGKWDAVWPNDLFMLQLLEYEKELQKA